MTTAKQQDLLESLKDLQIGTGTIGHIDHGKTTLTAAITKYLSKNSGGKVKNVSDLDNGKEEKERGVTISAAYVQCRTKNGLVINHIDCPGHKDFMNNMITGAANIQIGLLVISGEDGCMPQTKEHMLIANILNVKFLIVVINKIDLIDEETAEMVQDEAAEKLSEHNYVVGENCEFIKCSALQALNEDKFDGIDQMVDLIEKYAHKIYCQSDKLSEKPFMLYVGGTNNIPGRGTVVTGVVKQGSLKKGDKVSIAGYGEEITDAVVSDMESNKKSLEVAVPGCNIGLLLRTKQTDILKRGMVVFQRTGNENLFQITHINVMGTVMSKEEHGNKQIIKKGFSPFAFIDTASVTVKILSIKGIDETEKEAALPGEDFLAEIRLTKPVIIQKGAPIILRNSNETIAKLRVTDIKIPA